MLARNRTSLRFIQSTNLKSTLSQGELLLGDIKTCWVRVLHSPSQVCLSKTAVNSTHPALGQRCKLGARWCHTVHTSF